jgi:hypothetical protein
MILTSVSVNGLTSSVTQFLQSQQIDKSTVSAEEQAKAQALKQEREEKAAKIDAYFSSKNLPVLVGHGMTFVTEAETHGIPYNLVAAIAMAESTGCKFIIPGTNNCFGWGGGKIKFVSIDSAIATISKNLGGNNPNTAKYYDNKSVKEILEMYNPPKIAPKYTANVTSIMNAIDSMQIEAIAS